ncbi:MAG TPA: tetratricopeptide repeat protein [Lysobacter sp.]|nr:tetratricopeptide repeat protein [Lysobacter sp.]
MAIDDLLDEHEQSERVLNWLRKNAAALIGGIVLGLGAIYGWNYWKQSREQGTLAAAARYEAAIDAIRAGDAQAAGKLASLEGAYRVLAGLELAKRQVNEGKRDDAIATLRGLKPEDPALADIVQVRLARLLIDAGKHDEALKLLADNATPAALEARGDAEFARGRREQAREAYAQALTKTDVAAPLRRLLELKLTQAGGTPTKPETQS